MVMLKELKLNLKNFDNDSLLISVLELSKELGENMQSSIFIAIQDAINSKTEIEIIEKNVNENRRVVVTNFLFSDGK